MKSATYRLDDGRHSLQAVLTCCGADISLQICGGQCHHIGALALGVPRESLAGGGKTSASVSVLCLTGHKDDEFARLAAQRVASQTGRVAVVSVGIHVSNATQADIQRLYDNFMRLLEDIIAGQAPLA